LLISVLPPAQEDPSTINFHKILFQLVRQLCSFDSRFIQWFIDESICQLIFNHYVQSPDELFVVCAQVFIQFLPMYLKESVSSVLQPFLGFSIKFITAADLTLISGDVNPTQFLALQFVCATIGTISNVEKEILKEVFNEIHQVLVSWQVPPLVLSSVIWCWYGLLVNYPALQDFFLEAQFLDVIWGALRMDWEICRSFEECPVCPILHCAEILFSRPNPPPLPETLIKQLLLNFVNSSTKELQLLAFNVIQVITHYCEMLVPMLLQNGLTSALTVGLNESFDVKFVKCRIVADLMSVSDRYFLFEIIQSNIFKAALECVPTFGVVEATAIVKVFTHGIKEVVQFCSLSEMIGGGISDAIAAMIENIGEVDDPELSIWINFLTKMIQE
jgi:hypothetical protein